MNNKIDISLIKEEVKNAIKNQKVLYIPNLFPEVLDWEQFINFFDYAKSDNYVSSKTRKIRYGLSTENLYLQVADIVNPETGKSGNNISKELDVVVDFFNEIFGHATNYAELYINLSGHVDLLNPHTDAWLAIGWTCIGSMEWRIYPNYGADKYQENYESYITKPEDIIIVPMDVVHLVVPLEPRASISLGYINK